MEGNKTTDVIATRSNPIYKDRCVQLRLNQLAEKGGKAYVDARLYRAPNESDLSWNGTNILPTTGSALSHHSPSGFVVQGRKQRAILINDAGRIARKIQQYLFSTPITREGVDEDWAKDCDGSGTSIDEVMQAVSNAITTVQWAWLMVARFGNTTTQAEREQTNNKPRFTLFPSLSVPDWSWGDDGKLRWIITETETVNDIDPTVASAKSVIRTLWRLVDNVVSYEQFTVSNGMSTSSGAKVAAGYKEIPFVLIGEPSSDPWWFDDVEAIQMQCMNLDSLHVENMSRSVYAQLIMSSNTFDSLQTQLVERYGAEGGDRMIEVIKEIARSADTPIIESGDEKGVTRYIQPNSSDLMAIAGETDRKRKLLFENAGFSLFNKETRQVESAESKQFDHLDTEATLKHRAMQLQQFEVQAVALAHEIDPAFTVYTPSYPTSFDVTDPVNDMQTITMIGNIPDATLEMRKEALRAAVRVMSASLGKIDPSVLEKIHAEIDAVTQELTPDFTQTDQGDSGNAVLSTVTEVQGTALNGAQISSIVSIIADAAAGKIPLESVLPMLKMSFPMIPDDQLSRLVDSLKGIKPAQSDAGQTPPAI